MAPLTVDPVALDGAGSSLVDVGKDIGLTLSTLTGALSGCGSMCGNDPVGEAMGNAYDRTADALVKAMTSARNGLVNLGDGVRMSAFNYSIAEAQSNVFGRGQPLPAPHATGRISAATPPSSVGAGDSAPAGWGWVAKYIGMIWPNGDSAKLRSAAAAWTAAGTQLLVTETSAAGPLGIVGAQQIPEGEVMGQMFSSSISVAGQIMSETATVAGQLTTYAGQIDAVHASILDLLSRICDPMTGIKEIWDVLTDEDEDEIKQIADDIKTVVDNFSSEASALASQLSTAVAAAENIVSETASHAEKEWDQFLHGTDVGRVIDQVGQFGKGVWGEAGGMVKGIVTDALKYNQIRAIVDPKGFLKDVNDEARQVAPLVGLGGEGAPGVADLWKQVGKDVSHWDLWKTDPAEALGRTVTDVGSFFLPGGAEAKVADATHALENVGEHVPGALDKVAGATTHADPPPIKPTPEAPAPPTASPKAPADAPPPAPRSGEPSSAPADAPRPSGPTESRPPANTPAASSDTPPARPTAPAAAAEGTPGGGGPHGPEPVSAPSVGGEPVPSGHGGSPAAGGAGGDPPKLPDLGGIASGAGSAGEGLPKLPDDVPPGGGKPDPNVFASVGAHTGEAGDGVGHGDSGSGHGGHDDHTAGDDKGESTDHDTPVPATPVAVEGHDYGLSPEHALDQLRNPADEIARLHDAGVPASVTDGYDPLAGHTIEQFQREFTFRGSDGHLRWDWAGQAPNDGFAGVPAVTDRIPEGHELDRFGSNGGSFMSDEGAPLSARGMPPGVASDYNNFVGTGRPVPEGLPWEVRFGPLKEAFGQPGGANQWVVIDTITGEQVPVDMLIKKRMIIER